MPSFETVFRELGVQPEIQYNILEYARSSSIPNNLKSDISCIGTYKRIVRSLEKDVEDWNTVCVDFNTRVTELRSHPHPIDDPVELAEWEFHPRFDQVRYAFVNNLHERLGISAERDAETELLYMLKNLSKLVSCSYTMNKLTDSSPHVEIYQKTPKEQYENGDVYKKNTYTKTQYDVKQELFNFIRNLCDIYPGIFASLTKEESDSLYINIDMVVQSQYDDSYVDYDYNDCYDSEGDDEDYDF